MPLQPFPMSEIARVEGTTGHSRRQLHLHERLKLRLRPVFQHDYSRVDRLHRNRSGGLLDFFNAKQDANLRRFTSSHHAVTPLVGKAHDIGDDSTFVNNAQHCHGSVCDTRKYKTTAIIIWHSMTGNSRTYSTKEVEAHSRKTCLSATQCFHNSVAAAKSLWRFRSVGLNYSESSELRELRIGRS